MIIRKRRSDARNVGKDIRSGILLPHARNDDWVLEPRAHKMCVMKDFSLKSINICRNRTILASIERSRRDLSENDAGTKLPNTNSVSRGAIFIGIERFWRRSKALDEIYPITTSEPNSDTVKSVELTI